MKKLTFTFGLLLMGGLAMASNEIVSENVEAYTVETYVEAEGTLLQKCYARKCVTYEGADGYEYKRCTEWEEVDCKSVELAA